MHRTKVWAAILLIIALLGAAAAWPFHKSFWGGLALAAFEASLVGALADWFAVVALFRHPLGLKFIPHTAIIPNNRERIIETIVYMVENQWLRLEVLKSKVQEFKIFDGLSHILQTEEGGKRLRGLLASVVSNTLRDIEPETAAEFIQKFIRESFSGKRISPAFIDKVEESVKELYIDDIIDFLLVGAESLAASEEFRQIAHTAVRKAAEDYTERSFVRRLGRGLGEGFNLINYGEVTRSFIAKVEEVLEGLKSHGSPYRVRLKSGLRELKILEHESITAFIETWLEKTIHSEEGRKILLEIVRTAKEQLFAGDIGETAAVRYFADAVIAQVNLMNADENRKEQFEGWIKTEVTGLIERYHGFIGKLVRENLEVLNDEGFVASLEDRVGEDLQWIRINGTVIGALVGIIQYLIMHLVVR